MLKHLRAWAVRAGALFRRSRGEREFDEELASHLQLHIDDNLRAGMTPSEARRQALIALGGIEQTKEAHRDRRGIPLIETLGRDLRHGVRGLIKTPGFTLPAIVILGLGIGVNTAVFTMVNAVMLRPLPFQESDRLMRLWHTPPPHCSRASRCSRCRRPTSSTGRSRAARSRAWPSTATGRARSPARASPTRS